MKISVIIPSFNQALYIRATLESVLNQGYADLEVLVFDACSTDGTLDILNDFSSRIQWTSRPDRGQTDAINQGLLAASGDVIAYLNSDDIYYPDTLNIVDRYFQRHPECMILYGDAHHIWEPDGILEPYYTEAWDYDRLIDVCYLCQPAVFWRREVIERFGFFDDSCQLAMDYEYWLRVGRHVDFHWLKGFFLAGSRMYPDNKTHRSRLAAHEEILKVALRHADRPPYRWLKVLAHVKAEEACPDRWNHRKRFVCAYVDNVLKYAERYGMDIDDELGMYLENEVLSVSKD